VTDTPLQPAEQLAYARWLERGARLGLGVLVISFTAYLLGWTTPQVPLDQLPQLWSLPLAQYLERSGMPGGWGWLPLALRGDVSGLVGIVILTGCALAALAAAALVYLRKGDRGYAVLCVAEAAIIVLAASGLVAGGHG
jgi:hypothetical protein